MEFGFIILDMGKITTANEKTNMQKVKSKVTARTCLNCYNLNGENKKGNVPLDKKIRPMDGLIFTLRIWVGNLVKQEG